MNLLLDTHTLIWYLDGDAQLSNTCQSYIEDSANVNFVSIASFWEIAIKLSLGGKLGLSVPFEQLHQLVWQNNISILPIRFTHTAVVRSLPFHHKDPFDRLIIGQAMVEGMTILSRDGHFPVYGIPTVW